MSLNSSSFIIVIPGCSLTFMLTLIFMVSPFSFWSDTLSLRSPEGQKLQDNVTGRAGEVLDLHCCTSEQNTVTWYYRRKPEGPWKPYPWCNCSYSIFPLSNSRNQTLRQRDPYVSDAGDYRCLARQEASGRSVDHVVTVSLYSKVILDKFIVWRNMYNHIRKLGFLISLAGGVSS